jgi:hypothetical protein
MVFGGWKPDHARHARSPLPRRQPQNQVTLAGLLTSGLASLIRSAARTYWPRLLGRTSRPMTSAASFPVTATGSFRIRTGFPILPAATSSRTPATAVSCTQVARRCQEDRQRSAISIQPSVISRRHWGRDGLTTPSLSLANRLGRSHCCGEVARMKSITSWTSRAAQELKDPPTAHRRVDKIAHLRRE